MNIKSIFAGLLAITVLAACKSNHFETTKSGIQYKLYAVGKGKKVETGDLVSVNYILTLQKPSGKDTTLVNTFTMGGPEKVLLKETDKKEDFVRNAMNEIVAKMAVGDSATFIIPVDSIDKKVRQNVPVLKEGGKLTWNIKVADVMVKADYKKKQLEAKDQIESYIGTLKTHFAEQATKDSVIINDYIKKNNLDAKSLPSGLYYVIEQEGAGDYPLPFQTVVVDYKGYLTDGTVFDNSYDRGEPYPVPVGVGQVIPGWDEGLMLFKKGGKGKLLIPSYLAYGDKENGKIPANSVLIFDISIVDIK